MRQNSNETIEHHECPPDVARELEIAGGTNRFGEPMFRVVWGYDRIVPMTGEWQEFEHCVASLTDKLTGFSDQRTFIRLVKSVVETRHVPKYLPANCWHLEKWCPPEDYGSPEIWRKQGEEIIQGLTVDTAGKFPRCGEYELVMPLTTDFTNMGKPLPLVGALVAEIVGMVRVSKERFSLQQRKAAIEQRLQREEQGFTRKAIDIMKDGLRPYAGEKFVTVPEGPKLVTES
jgi:hypothetical protein